MPWDPQPKRALPALRRPGWSPTWGVEETDNAQLQAEITQIASRLPGTIARVLPPDNAC